MEVNKHALNENTIKVWIIGFVLLVVLLEMISKLWPSVASAGDLLNTSGFPLGSFFASTGAIWYVVAIALIVLLFKMFGSSSRK